MIYIYTINMNLNTAEKAIKALRRISMHEIAYLVVPNPGFLMKKIPTWKLTVKEWDAEEFKTQTSLLFEELNEVGIVHLVKSSNMDGFRRSSTLQRSKRTLLTRRTTRIR